MLKEKQEDISIVVLTENCLPGEKARIKINSSKVKSLLITKIDGKFCQRLINPTHNVIEYRIKEPGFYIAVVQIKQKRYASGFFAFSRGDPHNHTTLSDGGEAPEVVAQLAKPYRDWIVLTDHDIEFENWKRIKEMCEAMNQERNFTCLSGCEMSSPVGHICIANLTEREAKIAFNNSRSVNERFEYLISRPNVICCVAHPNLAFNLKRFNFIEVVNLTQLNTVTGYYKGQFYLRWKSLLNKGYKVRAMLNSDNEGSNCPSVVTYPHLWEHGYTGAYSSSLRKKEIVHSLQRGSFFGFLMGKNGFYGFPPNYRGSAIYISVGLFGWDCQQVYTTKGAMIYLFYRNDLEKLRITRIFQNQFGDKEEGTCENLEEITIDERLGWRVFRLNISRGYIRAEVEGENTWLITNPIWIKELEDAPSKMIISTEAEIISLRNKSGEFHIDFNCPKSNLSFKAFLPNVKKIADLLIDGKRCKYKCWQSIFDSGTIVELRLPKDMHRLLIKCEERVDRDTGLTLCEISAVQSTPVSPVRLKKTNYGKINSQKILLVNAFSSPYFKHYLNPAILSLAQLLDYYTYQVAEYDEVTTIGADLVVASGWRKIIDFSPLYDSLLKYIKEGGSIILFGGCNVFSKENGLRKSLENVKELTGVECGTRFLISRDESLLALERNHPIFKGLPKQIEVRLFQDRPEGESLTCRHAQVLARWTNGGAAIVVNRIGKGEIIYFSFKLDIVSKKAGPIRKLIINTLSYMLRSEFQSSGL